MRHQINFEIDINKEGRPVISIESESIDTPEAKFCVIEVAKIFLTSTFLKRQSDSNADERYIMDGTTELLTKISDEMASIIWEYMEAAGETSMIFDKAYHIQVEKYEKLESFEKDYIFYNEKLFYKKDGLKALVLSENKVYELKDNKWTEI
jgi:hypothetical protein